MKIFIEQDYEGVSLRTAQIVAQCIKDKPNLVFCLPAGGSPIGMYEKLVEMFKNNETSYKDMITFDMDEYVGIQPQNENSYAYFMQKHFLKYVDVKPENVHYPDGMAQDLNQMCMDYSSQIASFGGLDLAITGIGANGHIAFNEPSGTLYAKTHVVNLDVATIASNARFFNGDISAVPKQAVSIGMEEIMKSRLFLVVASGINKAALIKKTLESPMIDPMWPASFLHLHPNCIFIIDQQAASLTDPMVFQSFSN